MVAVPTALEIAANLANAVSILLATLGSRFTWPIGILGCALFLVLFSRNQLYADATLQLFFMATSVLGWRAWTGGQRRPALPISFAEPRGLFVQLAIAGLVCVAYALLLHEFTDAYAPLADSAVLAFSVLGQLLLMRRHVDAWWCWLLVNTIAAPLFWSRGLHLTAVLYLGFWINAIVALLRWRALAQRA